jgi:hypothetical protein
VSDEVTIYISPPSTERGPWRVRSDHRPVDELPDRAGAIERAAKYATMVENAGGIVVVKIEQPNGTWETYRA